MKINMSSQCAMFWAKELTPDPHLFSVLQFESYKQDTEKVWGNNDEFNLMQSQLFAWCSIFRPPVLAFRLEKVDAAILVNIVKLLQ